MSFLAAIRNSINGTTNIFENKIEGRWKFFALSFLIFGVLQFFALFIFFFVYFEVSEDLDGSLEWMLESHLFSHLFYYSTFGSGLIYIFQMNLIHNSGGSKVSSYNFGQSFLLIKARTFFWFLISYFLVQWMAVYFSSHTAYSFGFMEQNLLNPLLVETPMDSWYMTLINDGMLYFLRIVPWIVLGLYTYSLRSSKWHFKSVWDQRGKIFAFVIIMIAFSGLVDFIWQMFSNLITGALAIPFQNEVIPIIINIAVYLVYATFSFSIASYLAYFLEFAWEDEVQLKQEQSDNSTNLLDQ